MARVSGPCHNKKHGQWRSLLSIDDHLQIVGLLMHKKCCSLVLFSIIIYTSCKFFESLLYIYARTCFVLNFD